MRKLCGMLGLLLCCVLCLGSGGARAEEVAGNGALGAFAPDGAPLGGCPLEHTDANVTISGFVARVTVTQTFRNPFPDPIEAVYTFPLSDRGAVDAMRIKTGDREIRGQIERREEARRIYEHARQQGQLAALLDQERPNIFTQRVANLMPGVPIEIRIEYTETLHFGEGAFEWSFPTVVGPRFNPPDGRVGDAGRITPPITPEGVRAGHDLSISVEIDAGVPIRRIDSPLHDIDVERNGPRRASIRLAKRAEIPNRDFVLRYEVASERVESGWLAHTPPDRDGYATFVLIPPKRVTPRTAAPKELVFVIDRSGSQSGRPLLKAKETMLWVIENLNPRDTFQIVDFSNQANFLFDRPQPVTPDTKRRARTHIRGLTAGGGTMMAEAVTRVAAGHAEGNRLRIVTFMTDGYVGNDFQVIQLVRDLRGTSRWFPFGTGNSVNRFLIDGMARFGGGEAEYVLLDSDGDEVAKKFYERIRNPVLTDVELEFRNLDVYDVYPNELSDVWADRPLVIHARYRNPGTGSVVLRGFQGGEPYRQELRVDLPRRGEDNPALASMWARARVDDLMARDLGGLQSGSFPDDLREQIVQVALDHHLMTQFTSFVAVDRRVVNENGTLRTVEVPVEMPQGVEYEGIFGREEMGDVRQRMAPMAAKVGRDASAARSSAVVRQRVAGQTKSEELEDRADAPTDESARKLAPELLALLRAPETPAATLQLRDGRVRVKVVFAEGDPVARAVLEKLGLRIDLLTEDQAIGWIEPRHLTALAELDRVERVALP